MKVKKAVSGGGPNTGVFPANGSRDWTTPADTADLT